MEGDSPNLMLKSPTFLLKRMAAFMSTQKRRRGKRGTKERGKVFQMKQENENISFNFYLQTLVLVITEKQIPLYKYENCSPFLTYFFFKFSFF